MTEAGTGSIGNYDFNALAAEWWDPAGPMAPLHRMNGARAGWIIEQIGRHARQPEPSLIDVGCGGGLMAETLAGSGFSVTGIDVAADLIGIAAAHAERTPGLSDRLTYRAVPVEVLANAGERFDVVLALEVIEHVDDPEAFVTSLRRLLRPGGLLILSTPNRTALSWVATKGLAEYVLRQLPVGTHDWRCYLTPAELAAILRGQGLRVVASAGLMPGARPGSWVASRRLGVDYLLCALA